MKTDSLHNVMSSQISTPQKDISILIVDDEPINIAVLEGTLSQSGYQPLTADNGPLARQLAKEKTPDLILLDIMMPGESGFDVIDKLKNDSRTSQIPVIFLTATADVEKKLEGFRLGAVDYIVKPFHPEEVMARINLHLKLSRANQLLISCQSDKIKEKKTPKVNKLFSPTELPQAGFHVFQHRAEETGWDYYDVLQLSEHIFSFFIADISCKDGNTTFIASALKTLRQQNASPMYTPLDTMAMMNGVLHEILPGSNSHLTACLASLNRDTLQVTVTNSAHPPILNIPAHGTPYFMECRGDVMGIFPEVCFEMRTQPVEKGDRLVMYTDGLVERASRNQAWANELWRLREAASLIKDVHLHEAPEVFVRALTDPDANTDPDVVVLVIDV